MKDEIKNILNGVEGADKVLKYIEELEAHILHHHNHGDDCDCACHDNHDKEDDWKEIKTEYKNTLTVKDWEILLRDKTVFDEEALKLLKRMRHIADTTSFFELADTFGYGSVYYMTETEKLADKLAAKLNVNDISKSDFPHIFLNFWQNGEEKIFSLRPELYEALGNVDLSTVPLRENEL